VVAWANGCIAADRSSRLSSDVVCAGANEAIQSFLDSNPQAAADLVSEIPLRRIGDCELDIASAVLGLVSDDARFITGHVLGLDGGSHLRPPMAAATRLPVKLD
jgi:NAD(P)-dependent dehydrogenase (short-subunit alcohol dehydrogenase family)